MKATITFEDNAETGEVDVHVDFDPKMDQSSDAHHLAVAALKGLARYLEESEDGQEEDDE